MSDWTGDPYKKAFARRETLFMVGTVLLLISIPLLSGALALAACGFDAQWMSAFGGAGIVTARWMMVPAVYHDGAGWGMNLTGRIMFRLLLMPVGIDVLEKKR